MQEVAEFAIAKARDAGIRSVAIDGLSLHELPECIHELAYLQELNASENLLTNGMRFGGCRFSFSI